MKIFVFIVSISLYCSAFGQINNYWPHACPFPKCSTMVAPTNCTKVALGGDWNAAGSWSPSGMPGNNAIVCIPAGITINIKGSIYSADAACPASNTANTPRLKIFVCGTLQFFNSGKLSLACFSFIQVYSGGIIAPPTSGSGSSDLIQIGSNIVWGGPGSGNQPPVIGPYILSFPYIGAGVLPVAFDYFRAEQKQPYVINLEWATLQEINNTDFIIERSNDQRSWITIGTIKSASTSFSRNTYAFNDNSPLAGFNYYRIRQVDLDGRTSFSEVVRVTNQVKKNISIYPNPVNATAQLYSKNNFKAGQSIQIVDAKGSRVKTITASGKNSMQIDMSFLLPGLYLVQLIENGAILENVSLVKQ